MKIQTFHKILMICTILFGFALLFGIESTDDIEFKTDLLRLQIQRNPLKMVFKDNDGKILSESIQFDGNSELLFGLKMADGWDRIARIVNTDRGYLEGVTESGEEVNIFVKPIKPYLFEINIIPKHKSASSVGWGFKMFQDEKFRGMGQRFNGLELRGQEIPTHDQEYTVPTPFFLSSRGYGIYVETDGKFTFDLGTRDSLAYSFWIAGKSLKFYWIYGPKPDMVSKRYTELTGRMMLPPKWEFGLWKWRDWVWDESEVYEDAFMLRSLDIPATVILIDSPWSTEYITYEFNPRQFPDPKRLIDDLHGMGYRVLIWIVPFVNPAADNFKAAERKGYFVKNDKGETYMIKWWAPSGTKELGLESGGRGGMIDFTNPKAVKWWQKQIKKVVDLGIDGFKMDDCEQLPDDAVLFDGRKGNELKNYPLLYNKAVHDLMQKEKHGDFVLIPRAGWPGSQKYVPAFWAGDQNSDWDFKKGLPSVIRGAQSMGLIGYPFWGSDIGGYRWSPSKELFIRWTQFGAFCPIMSVGGKSYHEPWMFDTETIRIFRRFAQLHSDLFPYIWRYAQKAVSEGIPLMRPLFWDFPEDPQAWEKEFEYLFGGELLVAPIYQPGNERSVYLPKGQWMDFWSSEIYDGPNNIQNYEVSLSQIPLFIRVSSEAEELLLSRLLVEQLRGFKDRIEEIIRGEKKVLLKEPGKLFEKQLGGFEEQFPESASNISLEEVSNLERGVKDFRSFLLREYDNGAVPEFVRSTLIERLDMIRISIELYKKLDLSLNR